MGYDSDSPSRAGHDEDDDDEYEEDSGGNRLLGFMFGNVDDSGDLDADYLDEDAKEHLAAVADKLGTTLTDIHLSVRSSQSTFDATDQDYDEKAENAVNYEDIDEQYEGPEVQPATEEDLLLPKKDFFSTPVPVTTFANTTSVYDDENYDDEDADSEKANIGEVEGNTEAPPSVESEEHKLSRGLVSIDENVPEKMELQALEMENVDPVESDEDHFNSSEDSMDSDSASLLPVLCMEDGKAILRFSEIFGIHEPIKKSRKRESRYTVPKEKYISMDASDIVEEDEEELLKAPFRDFPWTIPFHRRMKDAMLDDQGNSVISDRALEAKNMFLGVDGHRKDSCVSAEPMKDEASDFNFTEWNQIFSPNFYSLGQQDWEEHIIWSNSPLPSYNFVESCELSGPDSDTPADKEMNMEVCEQEIQTESNVKDQASFLNSRAILVESFNSNGYVCISETRTHPQLLRLESRSDKDNLNIEGSKDHKDADLDAINRFSQLTLQNRDVLGGSWLDKIVWEPNQCIAKPKLILDLQDERMLFELSDMKDADELQLHAGAMIISRSAIQSGGDALESHGHGLPSAGRFNISNDKFYSNRKISQQMRSHSKKRATQGFKALHSVPALKLQTMKAKLSNKDVANFHRPKAVWYPHDIEVPFVEQRQLAMQGPIKIIIKSLGGRGSKLHVDAEDSITSVKAKASKKLDFKLSEPVKIYHSGKQLEDDKSLAEQKVPPYSVLHLIRTRIHPLPRAQRLPGENKSRRPPGAFKKKSDLSVKDGHVFLMEYCEERPLLLGNAGMGAKFCTYYQKSAPDDQTGNILKNETSGLGSVVVLDTADKSPYLGDIKPGTSQSCIETNMYGAPLFQHKVSSTDYLLVRSSKGKLSIRRIDKVHVVGQQEPRMEVMSPGSKNVQSYITNRLLVYMYREFLDLEKQGLRPSIRLDELSTQFPSSSDSTFVRKHLKRCVEIQKGRNGPSRWVMKSGFCIPSEEVLRRMVSPENVCAYESMQAGLYRLKRLGITKLTQPTGLSAAMNQLPDEAITLAAASHIERELQITPWNLSSNYVASTNQNRENLERLEISGVGDPSGRGLGFSYVRTIPKPPVANATVKKKTVVAKGSTVTGTDADLRRLSMDAARELLLKFNVSEDEIASLTRWHRIALIRKLSSEQAASGVKVDPTTVSKFARGQRMSFLQLQQQTREKCQEIWDRQFQSLCEGEGEENENESEANSDLDSFAGDLENLLDAEEGEEAEEDTSGSKNDIDGVKGLKMRRRPFQTQAEEEEDEAAEAAELCRMLMDEEEADRKNKKKAGVVKKQLGLSYKSKFGSEDDDRMKKNSAVAKRIVQPEESFSFRENSIIDQKEDESVYSKKHLPGKLKVKKMNESEFNGMLNKKLKIVGDGINAIKEKKSARETFVCGACGQFGHMRTNKNCPKYGVDSETRAESTDLDKLAEQPNFTDLAESSQRKPMKKLIPKLSRLETLDDDKPHSKAKVLKVKCGGSDKLPEKPTPSTSQNSDRPITGGETSNRSSVKVSKLIFSTRGKPDDMVVESHKQSVIIKPPMESDRDQPRKKVTIKQPSEIIHLDDNSQDGSFGIDYRKMRRINDLSGNSHREDERQQFFEESSRMREAESNQWWVEEQRINAERRLEERNTRTINSRLTEEQQPKLQILMYEESIRRERQEEEEAIRREHATKKNKRRPEIKANYLDDLPPRRNDKRIAEKERPRKRQFVDYAKPTPDYGQAPKRRRTGGKVRLSNILESIVELIKNRKEISFLFLKPVSKKEAPDYAHIVDHPMDLSKVRDRARRMEYRNRQEFRHDVCQIVYNAHLYNDRRNPGIPPLADQLLELCDYLLDQHDSDLAEAEDGIE